MVVVISKVSDGMGASTTSRRAPLRDAIDDGQPNLYKVDHDTHVGMSFG